MKKLLFVLALLIAIVPAMFAASELQKAFKKPQNTGTIFVQSVPKKNLPAYMKSMKVLAGTTMEDGIKIIQATEAIPEELFEEEQTEGEATIKVWTEKAPEGKPGSVLYLITGNGQAMMMFGQGDIEALRNDTTMSAMGGM